MAFARPQAIQQFAPIGDDGTDGQAILVDTTGRILAVIQTALPAGDAAIGRVKVTDGTDVALVTAAGELSVNVGNPGDIGGGTQYTEGATDASITGTAMMMEGAGDALVAAQGTAANGLEVDVTRVTGTVTVDGSGVTQPVSAASLPLPTGAATAANQQSDALTDTELRATAVPVSVATVPSHAVTNAGTFAVQDATAQASLSVMDNWDNGASDGASVSGDLAHDSPDAGEPLKVGFKAVSPDGTAPGTAVAENDRSNAKSEPPCS